MPSAPPSRTDLLASIRTDLANERTLLAYLRTGLALVVAAVTARQLLDDPVLQTLGLVVGVLGGLTVAVGVLRFFATRRAVRDTVA